MENKVPRVASSLDDLRVGQVVVIYFHWSEVRQLVEILETAEPDLVHLRLQSTDEETTYQFGHPTTWTILSDPPSDPVTVSRWNIETIKTSLKMVDGGANKMEALELVAVAARALVDEVRGQTDAR